jgi:hypothetical protein
MYLGTVSPRPNCPSVLLPHVYTLPSSVSATECSLPAAIANIFDCVENSMAFGTGDVVGIASRSTTTPLPSCPRLFSPHLHIYRQKDKISDDIRIYNSCEGKSHRVIVPCRNGFDTVS